MGLGNLPTSRVVGALGLRTHLPSHGTTSTLASSATPTTTTLAQGAAVSIMSLGLDSNGLLSPTPLGQSAGGSKASDTIVVVPGIPALKRAIVDLIRADRYVDLGELPPAKGFSKPLTSLHHCLEGQVVLIQAADLLHSKKVIPDYATWAQCFSIYTAVVLTAHPERASSLLMYNAAIAKLSKKFKWPSWIVYDHNFRTEAADTGRTDWGKIDGSIYAQCFAGMSLSAEGWCTLCKSMDHTRGTCPYRPAEETAYKRQNSFPRPPAKRP